MIRVREHSTRQLTNPATGTWSFCAMFSTHTPRTQVHAVNAIIIKREDGS